MFRRLAPALAAALLAAPALADQMTIDRPIEAASLHEGALDMVAYYQPAAGGTLELSATFASRSVTTEAPVRLVIVLADGDDIAVAMPGYPDTRYRFARGGDAVTISARPVLGAGANLAGF